MSAVAGTWSLINSFAYSALLVERLAEADRAFTAVRASADRTNDPVPIAMLAISHGYALTRMGRLDEALAAVRMARSLLDLVPFNDSWSSVGLGLYPAVPGLTWMTAPRGASAREATAVARGELQRAAVRVGRGGPPGAARGRRRPGL